ncbi:hypothetical protein EAH_00026820 [Eimeria acervulina]|uniref:Uncharacterized protein n=1 Tax=Eimeria acervulina TaxID=5801 RepID=U6GUN9_EIMAC|nr:hypothetical protein EAH_00026820 [Eimeria acervulina]CDI82284.1 hypothetical protein EAH_00026820 [Eimeria acervulina]
MPYGLGEGFRACDARFAGVDSERVPRLAAVYPRSPERQSWHAHVAVSRHASQTDTPLGFDVQAYYPRASAAVPQVFVPAKGFRMDARVCIMPMLRCGHYKYILY